MTRITTTLMTNNIITGSNCSGNYDYEYNYDLGYDYNYDYTDDYDVNDDHIYGYRLL